MIVPKIIVMCSSTNYSFAENAGAFGLARGQLVPVNCSSNRLEGAKCFGGIAISETTNKFKAGSVLPISGDVLVVIYIGDDDNMFGNNDGDENSSEKDDSAATDYSLPLRFLTVVATIVSTFLI